MVACEVLDWDMKAIRARRRILAIGLGAVRNHESSPLLTYQTDTQVILSDYISFFKRNFIFDLFSRNFNQLAFSGKIQL